MTNFGCANHPFHQSVATLYTLIVYTMFVPLIPVGDGVLWGRLSDRPCKKYKRQLLKRGLDCLYLQRDPKGTKSDY